MRLLREMRRMLLIRGSLKLHMVRLYRSKSIERCLAKILGMSRNEHSRNSRNS